MFTFISSRFSLEAVQNGFLSTNYFSDTQWKYAKITLVALSIICTLATLTYFYRSYTARKLDPEDIVVPPHLSPKPPHDPKVDSKKPYKPDASSPKSADIKPEDKGEAKKPDVSSTLKQKLDDEELARQIQKELNQEFDDMEEYKDPKDLDAEFAKKLQAQFDAEEEAKKPLITPIKILPSKPLIEIPTIDPKLSPTDPKPNPTPIDPIAKPEPTKVESPIKVDSPTKVLMPAKPSPFTQIDKICAEISEKAFTEPTFSAVKAFKAVEPKTQVLVLNLLNEIIAEFEKRYSVTRIPYPSPVPAYFANDHTDRPMNEKKYLSLVGIRNLLSVGPTIIDDFRDTIFLGGEHNYAPNKGLNSFKNYTGNLVDLDIEFEAKNDHEAEKIAREMIIKFGQMCGLKKPKLTAEDVAIAFPKRKLHFNAYGVPTSLSNTDRSNCALWKRSRLGKMYYYANIPDRDTVLLATFKIPYVLAELVYRTKEHHGHLPKEFFDEFFNKGLSVGCFNEKGRALMDFDRYWNDKLAGVPSIQEDARRKIEKGLFGPVIQKQGADVAFKEALLSTNLMNMLDELTDFSRNGRPLDQWKEEEGPKIRNYLIAKGLWETTLYQFIEEADYFLLDEKTLNTFLKDYYTYQLD